MQHVMQYMTAGRGRPRKFNEEEALAAMVQVFWKHGYDATTVRMLEEATGIGIRGIANVFGDKDAIFLRVLETYTEQARGILEMIFNPPSAASIEQFFTMLAGEQPPESPANFGCLMVNTVLGLGRLGDDAKKTVDAYRAMWKDYLIAALTTENLDDVEARAEFLLNLLWGALAQIRLEGSTTAAAPMATVAIETVNGWKKN